MIMRGVVQGVGPSLEEAAQTLRADRRTHLPHRDAAAAQARARQRLPGRLHREHRRLRQPDRRRRPVLGAVDRDLLRDRRRAVRPGPRRVAGAASCSRSRCSCSWLQRRLLGTRSYTTVTGKGDGGLPMPLPDGCAPALPRGRRCRGWRSRVVVYVFAFAGGFVQTWGRDYTPTLRHFVTAFDISAASRRPGLGAAPRGTRSSRRSSSRRSPRRSTAGFGLLIAWLLARHDVPRPAARSSSRALLALRDSGHGARRELHPGLQRAAVRAHRHRR